MYKKNSHDFHVKKKSIKMARRRKYNIDLACIAYFTKKDKSRDGYNIISYHEYRFPGFMVRILHHILDINAHETSDTA